MRPILYNANETAFETYGLGEIDATKAQVTRERNGNYTLYIEYPASGPLAGTFKNDMRIKSDAGLRTKNQTFFISRIVKDSTGILKVYAKHISHLTETMAIRNNTNVSGTAQSALSIWASNCLGGIRFDVWSDIELMSKASWNIADFKTARDVLGGVKGSILDVWGGEYEFDNTVIRLHKQLGRKSPTVLEYGRNILRAEDDQDIEGAYTSVYPYATYTPENQGTGEGGATSQQVTVELPEKYVDGPYIGLYNERRVLIVDFSSNFKDKEVPTIDKLRRLAKEYAINNRLGLPKINTKIEYVDLSKTLDYKLTQILEEAELCDIVPVYYPQIGLTSEDAKLTTIVYDVLLEQNDSVEVGVIGDGFKSSMTSNLSGKIDDLASNQQRLVNTLPDYLLNAQGNKVWYNRPDNKEHKIGDIWFEKNGLYDRMYVWNGSMWEKRIDTEDVDNIKKEVEKKLAESKQATDDAMDRTRAIADLALQRSGSNSIELASKKIIKKVLDGELFDRSFKKAVNKTFEEDDNGSTIYGKISSEIEKKFITIDATDSRFRQVSEQINSTASSVNDKLAQTNRTLTSTMLDLNQAKTDISNTRLYIRDANQKIDETNQKVSDVDGRVDRTNRNLETTNAQVEANKRQIEVQVTNFNAVRESTKLFERILGTTEEGAPDKLSRLVMSSEIFQTEVGKYSTQGGPNMLRNSRADDGLKYWTESNGLLTFTNHQFYFNGQKRMFSLRPGAVVKSPRFIVKRGANYMLNMLGFDANSKSFKVYFCKRKKGNTADFEEKQIIFEGSGSPIFNSGKAVKKSFKFNVGDFDDGYLQFEYLKDDPNRWGGLFMTELDFYEGSADRLWQPAPEDSEEPIEAVRTQVTQLAGSWSVRNLTNSGDVLNSINLLANGTNRIDGRLTHITGQTIIDEAVIDSANLKKVSASKISGGVADFDKIDVINFDAENITTGTLKGINVKGSIFSSLDDSFYIDTKKNEFYLNEQTLFTFYNKNKKIYSYLGTGDRLGSDDGGGLIIGVDCDDTQMYKMHGLQNSRDLWSASSYTSTTLMLGADKQKKTGTILAKAPTGIKFSVKPSGVAYSKTYIEIGNTTGNFFENKIIATANKIALTADEELKLYSSGKIVISGGGGSSLTTGAITGTSVNGQTFTGSIGNFQSLSTGSLVINRKDLVGYFNNLAEFVVAIARNAGWKNIGDYRI